MTVAPFDPDAAAALAPAGYVTDACVAGDHEPNDTGTACYYCGLPAETIAPDEAARDLWNAYTVATDAIRDRAQEARAGGRRILADYRDMTRNTRGSWIIAIGDVSDAARFMDGRASDYERNARASRDSWSHGIAERPHFPTIRIARHELSHANDPRRNGCCDAIEADFPR